VNLVGRYLEVWDSGEGFQVSPIVSNSARKNKIKIKEKLEGF